jgi:hypothetical protein
MTFKLFFLRTLAVLALFFVSLVAWKSCSLSAQREYFLRMWIALLVALGVTALLITCFYFWIAIPVFGGKL